MLRQISIVVFSLSLGACASSGQDVPTPDATIPSAAANEVASDLRSDLPEGEIQDLDAPEVETSAIASDASQSDEVVCRREKPTGSKMSRNVCRTRAEIDARAEQDKEMWQRSRTTQTGGSCALNQNC
jgi:hypothetical protein